MRVVNEFYCSSVLQVLGLSVEQANKTAELIAFNPGSEREVLLRNGYSESFADSILNELSIGE